MGKVKKARVTNGVTRTRVNISIPIKLKEEMNKHPEVTWSRVAEQAFMKHIKELRKFYETESVRMEEEGERY